MVEIAAMAGGAPNLIPVPESEAHNPILCIADLREAASKKLSDPIRGIGFTILLPSFLCQIEISYHCSLVSSYLLFFDVSQRKTSHPFLCTFFCFSPQH